MEIPTEIRSAGFPALPFRPLSGCSSYDTALIPPVAEWSLEGLELSLRISNGVFTNPIDTIMVTGLGGGACLGTPMLRVGPVLSMA